MSGEQTGSFTTSKFKDVIKAKSNLFWRKSHDIFTFEVKVWDHYYFSTDEVIKVQMRVP